MGKIAEKTAFQRLLDTGEQQCGQKQRLAEALGITPSRYSKLYGGEAYSLSVENCLRLAKLLKRSPAEVLRAANKAEVAKLLDELYGDGTTDAAPLPPDVQDLAHLATRLNAQQRRVIDHAIRAILGEPIGDLTDAQAAPQPSARRRR